MNWWTAINWWTSKTSFPNDGQEQPLLMHQTIPSPMPTYVSIIRSQYKMAELSIYMTWVVHNKLCMLEGPTTNLY